VKSPIQRRVAIAALLLAPALTACGFNEQTDQVYQAALGVNDRSDNVYVLNGLIVSGVDGSGTFAGTLVNTDTTADDTLDSVSGTGISASTPDVAVPAGGTARLAESGDVTLEGAAIVPGKYVQITLGFSSGQTTTMKVPVVAAAGDYADVPLPTPSKSPTKSS
jgi:hypothetical protein